MFKVLFVALIAAPLCQAGIAGIDINSSINGSIQNAIQSFDLPAPKFQIQKSRIETISAQSVATSISSGQSASSSNSSAIAEGSSNSDKLFSSHNAASEAKSLAQEGSVSKSDSLAKTTNKSNVEISVVPNID